MRNEIPSKNCLLMDKISINPLVMVLIVDIHSNPSFPNQEQRSRTSLNKNDQKAVFCLASCVPNLFQLGKNKQKIPN